MDRENALRSGTGTGDFPGVLSTGPDQLRNINSEIPDWTGRWAPVYGWACRLVPVLEWFLQLCRKWPVMGRMHPPAPVYVLLRGQTDCYHRNREQKHKYIPRNSGTNLCHHHRCDCNDRSACSVHPVHLIHPDVLQSPDSRYCLSAVCALPYPLDSVQPEAALPEGSSEVPAVQQLWPERSGSRMCSGWDSSRICCLYIWLLLRSVA